MDLALWPRDFISHLRYDLADANGQANPLAAGNEVAIDKAYCWGRSQTGRLIRETVYQGFNADTSGRKVFDGVLAHVAGGGRMVLNHRFACGTDAAGQQLEAHDKAADRFPFAYADHLTGQPTHCYVTRKRIMVMRPQTGTNTGSARARWYMDTQGNDLAIPDGGVYCGPPRNILPISQNAGARRRTDTRSTAHRPPCCFGSTLRWTVGYRWRRTTPSRWSDALVDAASGGVAPTFRVPICPAVTALPV